jgi:predicted TIM-barrel enzyme
MAGAGADIIVCHLGLTTGRQHRRRDRAEARRLPGHRRPLGRGGAAVKPDAIILVHGGPVAMPEDAEFILKNTAACHGFYGASSMERLPTEIALTEQTRAFKRIKGR